MDENTLSQTGRDSGEQDVCLAAQILDIAKGREQIALAAFLFDPIEHPQSLCIFLLLK
jgi:hypothetical protein